MLWIVLPFVTTLNVIPVTALNVIHAITTGDIRIAIEIVVDVDIDVIVSPTGIPAPTSTTPCRSDRNSDPE